MIRFHESDEEMMSRIICKWKDQLEAQYLAVQETPRSKERVYICSPCAAGTAKDVNRNIQSARFYMWYTFENMSLVARAPHAYLPILLNDNDPAERGLALKFGLELLQLSERVFVCGNRISNGMKNEIRRAAELKIPITVFCAELFVDVQKLVTRAGASKTIVEHGPKDSMLRLSPEEIFG